MSKTSRRDFIKSSAIAAFAFAFSRTFLKPLDVLSKKPTNQEVELPAGEKKLDENDAVAKALGFHHHVKDVDFTKYPQRKKPEAKDQFCKNCALYTAKNDGWGKCQMLANGLVSSQGWCGSWNKKA